MIRRACAVAIGLACWLALTGRSDAARFALLVGNNQGHASDGGLRFSESDTTRLADVLTRLGHFSPSATVIQLGHSADEVRGSLAELARRLRAMPGEHLVLVYYSGHADAQALHLGAASFPLAELKETVSALPAATRILILDACQAGVLTRPKGGQAGPGFEVELGAGEGTKGLAILASSAGSELAQESDQLGASVFTHFLEIGLAGLADRNGDGNVSLTEVFDYTSERTLATTFGTATGPQHPTFRMDLTGRDNLVLTQPGLSGAGYGHLRLDVPGWYFIRRRDGTIAAEVVSRGDESLALELGAYEVTRRQRNSLDVASVTIDERATTAMSQVASHPVAFGRMVRKGGGPTAAYGLAATTVVRTPLEDLGAPLGAKVTARADLSAASFELRLGLGRAHQEAAHLTSTTWDASASVAVLHVSDGGGGGARASSLASRLASRLTWAWGLELGVAYMSQRLDDGEDRASFSPFAGPVALVDVVVSRRLFLRAEVGVPIYALRVERADGMRTLWRPAVTSGLGGGVSF